MWNLSRHEDDEAGDEGIGRILALSDGVFAIAITLLIIEITLPARTTDADLSKTLLDLWPRYLAYGLSFLVIARFWVIHRLTFKLIARDDPTLMWINFLFLLFVAFLPFPTAVLGAHGGTAAAAVLYAISVGLASAASAAVWWYASSTKGLLRPGAQPTQVRAMRARSLAGPAFFALTVPVAVFAPVMAEILWVCAFPLTRVVFVRFLGSSPAGKDGGR